MARTGNQVTYNQMTLCKEVAKKLPQYTIDDVRNITETMSDTIKDHLTEADETHSIQTKFFNGFSLVSWLEPAKKNANVFGMNLDIDSFIQIKPTVTKYLKRRINEQAFA